jgi:hypothetical protein
VVPLAGEYFMYYGSDYDRVYLLKLDTATGPASAGGIKEYE